MNEADLPRHINSLPKTDDVVKPCVKFNVIIIPDNATNGDVIKLMFPDARVGDIFPIGNYDEVYYISIEKVDGVTNEMRVMKSWWDAPYKKEVKANDR